TFINEAGCAGLSMNSFNHLEMTSVTRYLVEEVIGIKMEHSPACKKWSAHVPESGMPTASAKFNTPRGTLYYAWNKTEGTLTLTVPVGAEVSLTLPQGETHLLHSGSYDFTI
ncbi:MAG: hypothetical protein IKC56_04465, partial [Clostridia bacterium]|nr:hypothetical protein [Clostridia bacterium]